MSMSIKVSRDNDYRTRNSDTNRSFAFKLRMLMSDIVRGDFNHHTKENKPGTGRPWIQTAQVRVHGIDGWAAVDGFEQFNQPFTPLTENDVISAVLYGRGLFATMYPLRDDEFFPAFLTHHIADYVSLDRLKSDLKWMFNLSLAITRKDDRDIPEIVPHCHAKRLLREAVDQGHKCIVTRLGTENELRRIAQYGISMTGLNTDTIGRFTAAERSELEGTAGEIIQTFLDAGFDDGVRWGEYPDVVADENQSHWNESVPAIESIVIPPKIETGELALAA